LPPPDRAQDRIMANLSPKTAQLLPPELIERRIYLIRGHKVMLSPDLATLYQVEPRALVQAVKRNVGRFPSDFMFQLNQAEFRKLKSQIVISSWGGARRGQPYAFTEQGVAMLSSVLRSQRAIRVNIAIMRTFVRLREMLTTHRCPCTLSRAEQRTVCAARRRAGDAAPAAQSVWRTVPVQPIITSWCQSLM
jgi:hypothetical protein